MPTGSWIVRLLGKTGSDWRTVKVTRMTQPDIYSDVVEPTTVQATT
jgi:hypothetical protein